MSFTQAYICNQCGLTQRKYVPPLLMNPFSFNKCCPKCGAGVDDIRLAIGEWKQERIVRGIWPFRFVEYVDTVFEEKVREELPPGIFEEPEPQTRLSGTMDKEVQPNPKVDLKCPRCHAWSPATEWVSTTGPKACDHPCHKYPQDIGVEPWLWKVCPMGCGLPLAGKEEKP